MEMTEARRSAAATGGDGAFTSPCIIHWGFQNGCQMSLRSLQSNWGFNRVPNIQLEFQWLLEIEFGLNRLLFTSSPASSSRLSRRRAMSFFSCAPSSPKLAPRFSRTTSLPYSSAISSCRTMCAVCAHHPHVGELEESPHGSWWHPTRVYPGV
jgi:hypothetical protein